MSLRKDSLLADRYCRRCRGLGHIRAGYTMQTARGPVLVAPIECQNCGGTGLSIDTPPEYRLASPTERAVTIGAPSKRG